MKVIIIGGTAAGMSAAAKLKRVDTSAEVVVYEKRDYVSFGACGLPYYVGGFFDDAEDMIARTPEQMQKAGIEVKCLHEVVEVDTLSKSVRVKQLLTGEVITDTYDRLMIATGATPIAPPIDNLKLKNIFNLHSKEDGVALKEAMQDSNTKKVAIVGAGFIGLEVVEAAKKLDKEVYVFQRDETILDKVFDKEVTDILEEELKQKGVQLYTSSQVTGIEGDEKVERIVTEQGSFDVDLVVIAIGVRPATSFLENTDIKRLGNGAIVVNEYGETSVQDVYAAGDCATVPHMLREDAYIPLATSANKLGRVVGENLGGVKTAYQLTLGSSCIKVLGMDAGRTGLSELEARANGHNVKTSFVTDMNQTGYYPGQTKVHVKLIYDAESKVLLGGQIVGAKDVVQRVNVLACAIYNKMTTETLGMLDLCYSPPFARTWDVLNIAGNASK